MRRIQYLHHLVTRQENEILYQFFITQWTNPTRGDWTEKMKEDLEEIRIPADFKKNSKMDNVDYEELKKQD